MSTKTYSINPVKTDFPMKANSQVREVEIQSWWESIKVYERNLEQRKTGEKFVLHDGPPYLSSNKIHIGHALNKIFKRHNHQIQSNARQLFSLCAWL